MIVHDELSSARKVAAMRVKYIWWLQLLVVVFSLGSVFAKLASEEPILSARFFLFYGGFLAILMTYAIFWQKMLKHVDLTVAYVSRSVIVIWTLLWATILFGESVTFNNIIGGLLILAGVVVVGDT